jgi:hypothetical protein
MDPAPRIRTTDLNTDPDPDPDPVPVPAIFVSGLKNAIKNNFFS